MTIHEKVILLCAGAVIALCGTATAADGPVGNVQVDGDALSVTPTVSYAALQVTVAGEGVYWQKSFAYGERVSASLSEIGALPDGSYGYEVITAPEIDEEARKTADGDEAAERLLEAQEAERTYLQQGGFEIVSGQVVAGASQEESGDAFDPQQLPE